MARRPVPDSAITKTLYSMRAIRVYAFPSRRAEMDERVAKRRNWLSYAKARSSYERAEILMGLGWAGADTVTLWRAGIRRWSVRGGPTAVGANWRGYRVTRMQLGWRCGQ